MSEHQQPNTQQTRNKQTSKQEYGRHEIKPETNTMNHTLTEVASPGRPAPNISPAEARCGSRRCAPRRPAAGAAPSSDAGRTPASLRSFFQWEECEKTCKANRKYFAQRRQCCTSGDPHIYNIYIYICINRASRASVAAQLVACRCSPQSLGHRRPCRHRVFTIATLACRIRTLLGFQSATLGLPVSPPARRAMQLDVLGQAVSKGVPASFF